MKQTAVEWLVEKHFGSIENCSPNFRKHIEQAKAMEKKQIIEAYEQGYRDGETNSNTVNYGIDISKFADAKIYYNETFKSE
jgi:flagellar basal body rod protein FlgB